MKKAALISFVILFAAAGPVFSFVSSWVVVEITPEHPDISDILDITVSGLWPNSCVPEDAAISVDGNDIYFDVIWEDPHGGCYTVVTNWKHTRTIGPLAQGKYNLYVRVVGYPRIPEEYILKARFIVSSGPVVYYVDTVDGNDLNFGDTPETALPTIQSAIDKARDGDTVIVLPGTYTGEGNRDIDFLGKVITVKSENGPNNCIINCNGTYSNPNRGFYFHSGEDANSVLDGFTIINGYASDGGGIYCEQSSPTITNCALSKNSANTGGGIYSEKSNPVITNCTLSENSAHAGGGIYSEKSNPVITNCTLSGNSAYSWDGGGILSLGGIVKINHCTFRGNSAYDYGGGICYYFGVEGEVIVTNCTFSENSAGCDGGGLFNDARETIINNCTFSENSADEDGGGFFNDYGDTIINNCTFSENSADEDGGGFFNNYGDTIINNCTFNKNRAGRDGGGIYNDEMSTITNSIFSGNFAHGNGGGIYNHMAFETLTGNCTFSGNSAGTYGGAICTLHSLEPAITNCIFYEDSASFGNELAFVLYTYNTNIAYCNISNTPADIYLGPDCTLNWLPGNIDADPRFIKQGYWDPNGTPADANDDIWINGDYHLMPASPCINAGDPNYVPEPNETDLDGNPRIKDGRIDMGAYETIQHEAHLWIYPRMINRRSFQPRIMAWMRLPQGITKEQVDEDEPLILYPGGIKATRQFVIQSRGRFDRCAYVFAFFDKAELMDAIPENGQVELQALGCLLEPGQYFYGNDTVRITAPWPRRRWPYYYWYW